MNNIIDSHFHIDAMIEKDMDIQTELELCNDMFAIMDISTDLDTMQKRVEIINTYNQKLGRKLIYSTLGLFPNHCTDADIQSQLDVINGNVDSFDALGEIGIDYHYDWDKSKQKNLFATQLEIAISHKKPIVIHTRDSIKDTIDVLSSYKYDRQNILHCFSEDRTSAKKLVDMGFLISFAGTLTFKKSELPEVLEYLPLDRILFETDAPFLTPRPLKTKLNTPSNVKYTYQFACEYLNVSMDKLTTQVKSNFCKLFEV